MHLRRSGGPVDIRRVGFALLIMAVFLIALEGPAASASADTSVTFNHGVASGDVTPISAILWTRTSGDATVTVEVARNPGFTPPVLEQVLSAQAANDFTVKTLVAPLAPNTTYTYRFRTGSAVSDVGTFKTAPSPSAAQNLHFVWTADSDGTRLASGAPAFNNFETLAAARAESPDFFVYLGDTIYGDSFFRPAPATTLSDYRAAYRVNRDYSNLRNLLSSTSTYAQWDDHEVYDNFAGQTVDLSRFAAGREAFLNYMPTMALPLLRDAMCAGSPMFRAFKWGQAADLFIPDERSCRSPQVDNVTTRTGACNGDFAPTLPSAIRARFSGFFGPLPSSCLAAINDPSRTMLGPTQKWLLEQGLLHSTARFKFVMSEVVMQQEYVDPYDRWEGYAAERSEILNFIRTNHISNVIFLSADDHSNLINDVFIDRVTDPMPIASEFVTGPVAYFTDEQIELGFLGPTLGPLAVLANQQILSFAGVRCRNLDTDSYGVVDIDATAGSASVTLKRSDGQIVADQVDPNIGCVRTIGP